MNDDSKLESLIGRALQELPDLSAPATLLPRVQQAIRAQSQRPWWQKSWTSWPLRLQTASLTLLGTIAIGLSLAGGWAWNTASRPQLAEAWQSLVPALGDTLFNALVRLLRHASPHGLVLVLAAASLMYLTCVGVGTLCLRLMSAQR